MNDNPQDSLLTPDERKTCEEKTAAGLRPHSQRAMALLMLDTGATAEEAAAQSGLTINQIKFWSGRFRTNRLAIFPSAAADSSPRSNVATTSVTAKVKPEMESGKKKGEKKKDKKAKNKSSKKKGKKNQKKKSGKKKDKKAKDKSDNKKDKKNQKKKSKK